MVKRKAKGQKWLKSFHLVFDCLWLCGAISVNLMLYFLRASDGMRLYGINQSIKFLDVWIIIPGNAGIILMGIAYSIFTNWGWFKHKWISAKWIVALYGMVFGIIWLGRWAASLDHTAKSQGLDALSNTTYLHNQEMLYW